MCKVPSREILDYWLPSVPCSVRISDLDFPPANLLGLVIDNWRDLNSLGMTTVISDREPWVVIMVSEWPSSFFLDTKSTYPVLMEYGGLYLTFSFPYCWSKGQPYQPHQTSISSCISRVVLLSHSFLVIPTCPVPLLGRDLQAKVGTSISFAPQPHSPDPKPASSPSPPSHLTYWF